MDFRTPISYKSTFSISFNDSILMLGSCFSNNIGLKFQQAKMNVTINPFGVLFNPMSIASTIEKTIDYKPITESELLLNNNLWVNLDFHGSFSSTNKYEALQKMNSASELMHKKLSESTFLIITFGTAYVYKYLQTNKIVANCHKLPSNQFVCERLTVDEIVEKYIGLINNLLSINSKLQFVFTVSPIRHLRDGLHNNQLSKSTLLLAIEQLTTQFKQVHYFPSYEILIDDLRDYRFYDTDMLHPSSVAVDYIWQVFCKNCISAADNLLIDEIAKIENAVNHKPINPNSVEFQQFVASQIKNIDAIRQKLPNINFTAELEHFKHLSY